MTPRLQPEATAVRADPTVNPADKEASASGGLVGLIIQIGRERQPIVEYLRDALLNGDDAEALERARELTSLPTTRSVITSPSTPACG